MKKSCFSRTVVVCLLAFLTVFLLTGCPGLIGSMHTVTLVDGDSASPQKVSDGDTFYSYNPYKSYNYFLYWSESKKSLSSIRKFDKNTPIKKDITLYAIYTPKLDEIQSVSNSEITIILYDTEVYPLDDGNYAGLEFSYSTDGTNFTKFNFTSAPTYSDLGGYRYLTYDRSTMDTTIPEGNITYKVTNGHETSKYEFEYISPENAATITFIDNGTTKATRTILKGTSLSSSKKPINPSKSYNYFLYWSESKASKETATEFDFTQPINEDKTL
nr:hypothetical protein [Treponemataceae bacterium]